MTQFRWREIAQVPEESGVYAWYYKMELTSFDIERLEERIKSGSNSPGSGAEAVREFFDSFVFRFFAEQPYSAVLRGQLKPTYEGKLHHRSKLSDALVERILEEPKRVQTIKRVLEECAPLFSSPLYIGMASNLRSRLSRHKSLIEKLLEERSTSVSPPDIDSGDHSFALEIVTRRLVPTRLFVAVKTIPTDENDYVDIENILNRINFPLLGRN